MSGSRLGALSGTVVLNEWPGCAVNARQSTSLVKCRTCYEGVVDQLREQWDIGQPLVMPGNDAAITTAVISIVRNEMDILPAWLGHTRALVDYCYMVDHLSQDGTYEYLKDYTAVDPSVRLYSFRDRVYDRERIIRKLRALVTEETDAEWVFILDPDEFLPYSGRFEFEVPLQETGHNQVVF